MARLRVRATDRRGRRAATCSAHRHATEWVAVLGKGELVQNRFDWRISSYLTRPGARAHALQEHTQPGSNRRRWDQLFEEGMRDEDEHAEFFVQCRTHHGLAEPTLELTLSFLWYFDAIPRNDGSWYPRHSRPVDRWTARPATPAVRRTDQHPHQG